jgi:hypothetical protein
MRHVDKKNIDRYPCMLYTIEESTLGRQAMWPLGMVFVLLLPVGLIGLNAFFG